MNYDEELKSALEDCYKLSFKLDMTELFVIVGKLYE